MVTIALMRHRSTLTYLLTYTVSTKKETREFFSIISAGTGEIFIKFEGLITESILRTQRQWHCQLSPCNALT